MSASCKYALQMAWQKPQGILPYLLKGNHCQTGTTVRSGNKGKSETGYQSNIRHQSTMQQIFAIAQCSKYHHFIDTVSNLPITCCLVSFILRLRCHHHCLLLMRGAHCLLLMQGGCLVYLCWLCCHPCLQVHIEFKLTETDKSVNCVTNTVATSDLSRPALPLPLPPLPPPLDWPRQAIPSMLTLQKEGGKTMHACTRLTSCACCCV